MSAGRQQKLEYVPASAVSLREFAAALNLSFSGYQFPISLDVASYARRARIEHHDFHHSLLARDSDGRAAGVAVLAIRGSAGWVGGFGVVPERRGRGLGHEMMSALLERARSYGLERLSLEVLAGNDAARKIYERAGMRVSRDLLLVERTKIWNTATSGGGAAARAEVSAREAAPGELLRHFARLHAEPPAWQRDLPALLVAHRPRGLCLGAPEQPEAYALVSQSVDGNTYVIDLAAADPAGAAALCAALPNMPGPLKVVNEPARGLFDEALAAHGFKEVARQHEMVLDL